MVAAELVYSLLAYFKLRPEPKGEVKIRHSEEECKLPTQRSAEKNASPNRENSGGHRRVMKNNFMTGAFKENGNMRFFDRDKRPESNSHPASKEFPIGKKRRSMSASSERKPSDLAGLEAARVVTGMAQTKSRPASAFSVLSTFSQPFTRSPIYVSSHPNRVLTPTFVLPDQVEAVNSCTERPESTRPGYRSPTAIQVASAQPSPSSNEQPPPESSDHFAASKVSPLYERQMVAPTPMSTRSPTPLWDSGEKKVRFLESEVVGSLNSRPSSGASGYSNIIKNSSRYSYVPNEPDSMYGFIGHSAKICNCPCHFFPKFSNSIGVQVAMREVDSRKPLILRPYHPRQYRLLFFPSFKGLGNMSWWSKLINFIVRALLSQLGLLLVVIAWWLMGALVFSTLEGPFQRGQVRRMELIRNDLVIDLATELRQVRPFEAVWRTKIETYMFKMENAVLRAVKAGYTSSRASWTIADSFIYSVSLTTLLGPGGLVIQSSLTKGFSLVYASVGIPLLFLLLFNMAQTAREGLTWVWCWRGRRRQVIDLSGPTLGPTLLLGESEVTSISSPVEDRVSFSREISSPSSQRTELNALSHLSRVTLLENSLSSSRPNSATPPSQSGIDTREPVADALHSKKNPGRVGVSDTGVSSTPATRLMPMATHPHEDAQSFLVNRTLIRHALEREHLLKPKDTAPWFFISLFPPCYLLLGTTFLAVTQDLSIVSALFVIGSNFLSLDHGGPPGNRSLLTSETFTFLYSLVILTGIISMLIFTLGMWPKVTSSLGEAGKNLCVVKQIELYR